MVDPIVASLSVPATHILSNTDELLRTRIEIVCSMLIKVFYKIIHKLPPIFLQQFTLIRSLWLMTPPYGAKEVFEPLFWHPSQPKLCCRLILRPRYCVP